MRIGRSAISKRKTYAGAKNTPRDVTSTFLSATRKLRDSGATRSARVAQRPVAAAAVAAAAADFAKFRDEPNECESSVFGNVCKKKSSPLFRRHPLARRNCTVHRSRRDAERSTDFFRRVVARRYDLRFASTLIRRVDVVVVPLLPL